VGYVTRAVSGSDFDVNGHRILCDRKTHTTVESDRGAKVSVAGCPSELPFIGEFLIIIGPVYNGSNLIHASRIESSRSPRHDIAGFAVIDAAATRDATEAQASDLIIRADGYRIRITGTTKIEWNPPLQSFDDLKAGSWVRYKGKLDATGVLIAASVQIGANEIDSREEKLRDKNEYDPSAIPADARQNFLNVTFRGGYDPKKFPPFADAEMQARVEKIGSSLIPAYQRALPESDPAKIHLRFQVIDNKHFCGLIPCDAIALPSGIILVPHQMVERMQNDSQLAAVLADSIARALEKQRYRTHDELVGAGATALAGLFVPYAGGVMTSIGSATERKILTDAMEQSGRVSLVLLHDAGYDIDQAPIAWWLLNAEKPQTLSEIEIPDRATYLYRILGEVWNNPAASASQAH